MLRDLALFLSLKIGRGILKDKSSRYKGLKQYSLEKLRLGIRQMEILGVICHLQAMGPKASSLTNLSSSVHRNNTTHITGL